MRAEGHSEIKGVWLVTAKSWVLGQRTVAELNAVARHVDPAMRSALTDPLPSEWYPEETLQQVLRGMRSVLAEDSDSRFLELMRQCTRIGVNRFFRALLRLGSAQFVLRQVPTMWRQIRRGTGRVEVETESNRIQLRYRDFPYFDDPNYRLLTLGSLGAVVELCTSSQPSVSLGAHGSDWLDVAIET